MKRSDILSWAAIIVSLTAICFIAFRLEPITFDSMGFFGWVTAALSVMVVALTIFQFTTITGLRNDVRETAKEEDAQLKSELLKTIYDNKSAINNEWNNFAASLTKNVLHDIEKAEASPTNIKLVIKLMLETQAENASNGNDMDIMFSALCDYISFALYLDMLSDKTIQQKMPDIVQNCMDNSIREDAIQKTINLSQPWRSRHLYKLLTMIEGSINIPKDAIGWALTVAQRNGEITNKSAKDAINDNGSDTYENKE